MIKLDSVYSRDSIPTDRSLIPRPETALNYQHLQDISSEIMPYRADVEVGLLIGLDCSKAIKPRKLISGPGDTPWAVKTELGWGIAGLLDPIEMKNIVGDQAVHFAFKTQASQVKHDIYKGGNFENICFGKSKSTSEIDSAVVLKMFESDFSENAAVSECKLGESVQDRKFLKIMDNGLEQLTNGHFELPLPLKNEEVKLPNNRMSALKRLNGLKNRLLRNEQYKNDYCAFMASIFENGYAESVPTDELDLNDGRVWYIPHHGVYHPKKPDKIRVVFDGSMEIDGQGLNKSLLQGPNLTNNIIAVLLRFRQQPVAFSMDIEGMFHQVFVKREFRNYLRFFWWKNNDFLQPPQEFRMTVHLFGATSSPACANYALRATADMYEKRCGSVASMFVKRNFYVDDGLLSVETENEACQLIKDTRELCAYGGFNLHKLLCNRKQVLASVSPDICLKDIQKLDLNYDELPTERTLGIEWVVEIDKFQFRITLNSKPCTRRGILSTVSSIFDPLGLVSPFIMTGKKILQSVLQDKADWDDPVPEDLAAKWERWKLELDDLAKIQIPRCYKNANFGSPIAVELHHFSDASLIGYGECSYIRQINKNGDVATSLLTAKARVAPVKSMTVPRLELTAAVTAAKVATFLKYELDYDNVTNYFWTDSKVVLGYIRNEAKRFHIFVANRVQQIHDLSEVSKWNYVNTAENPSDLPSRGATPKELQNSSLWWNGPAFLQGGLELPVNNIYEELNSLDSNVRHGVVHRIEVSETVFASIGDRLQYFSCWQRARRALALCIRYTRILKAKINGNATHIMKNEPVNTAELELAETLIIKSVQANHFSEEIKILKQCEVLERSGKGDRRLKHTSTIYRLDPYLDENSIIHVGGRVRRANVPRNIVHPVVLPQKCHVTNLIIKFYHLKVHHSGRETTLNEIRSSGYWIIHARSAVTSFIWKCVKCRRYRGNTVHQKMSDLPEDRLEAVEPFTFAAVDYFGPFYIKEGRSEKKRWGVIFVCMASRAIHLETANSLDTDSFINAYRRFVSRRGPVKQLRSDRGTNFVGANSELNHALSEMNHGKISRELLKNSCDWIEFKMNVPLASHMGGSWERLIRSVRNILVSLLDSHGDKLDDESLRTLFAEAEVVVNSRPITYTDTTSADSSEPLSPIQLLTLKSRLVLPPPGEFQREDIYCKRRWRKVQFLADQFWTKWKNEYLCSLQERKFWTREQENLSVGDIVLMKDDNSARNEWPLGRIVDVYPSTDGLVRKVSVKIGDKTFDRPIQKLVLIDQGPRQGASIK